MTFVLPLAVPVVNWTAYLREVKRLIGRAPCSGVDQSAVKLTDLAKYTASLAEFQHAANVEATTALGQPGPWLRHTFYTFLVATTTSSAMYIIEVTDLDVLSTDMEDGRVLILSGNLQTWKDAVIICLNQRAPKNVREPFMEIKRHFTSLGLDSIWADYRSQQPAHAPPYLEHK